jgi:hypothetical protein
MFQTTAMGFAKRSTHPYDRLPHGCLCLTGKSVDLVGDCPVQPPLQRYFCFSEMQIRLCDLPSCPTEGRLEIVTDAGQDAVDADALIDDRR